MDENISDDTDDEEEAVKNVEANESLVEEGLPDQDSTITTPDKDKLLRLPN